MITPRLINIAAQKWLHRMYAHFKRHAWSYTLANGSCIVMFWTCVRLWRDATTYDHVWQQLLARTILADGNAGGATIGSTHYILKMIGLYLPLESLSVNPRVGILVITIFVNVTSYLLILYALRKILHELKIPITRWFYVGSLWLAVMAGSIFWMGFANSRNLEVAMALWMIAYGLRALYDTSRTTWIVFMACAVMVLYSDPLQVVMSGVPLGLYALYYTYASNLKGRWSKLGLFITLLGIAYIIAVLCLKLTSDLLNLSLLSTNQFLSGVISFSQQPIEALHGVLVANLRFFGGYEQDGGRYRQILILLSFGLICAVWIYGAWKRRLPARMVRYVMLFVLVIEGVYLASGQSLAGDTSRYLIMLAPVTVIGISSLGLSRINGLFWFLASVCLVGGVWVFIMTGLAWPERYKADRHLTIVNTYLHTHPEMQLYSSMDIALPTRYYYHDTMILPVACASGKLQPVRYLPPRNQQNIPHFYTGLLLHANTITNQPNTCTYDDIQRQFGKPITSHIIDPSSTVLLYDGDIVKRHGHLQSN